MVHTRVVSTSQKRTTADSLNKSATGNTSSSVFFFFLCTIIRNSAKHQPHSRSKNAPASDGLLGTLTTVWQSNNSFRALQGRNIVARVSKTGSNGFDFIITVPYLSNSCAAMQAGTKYLRVVVLSCFIIFGLMPKKTSKYDMRYANALFSFWGGYSDRLRQLQYRSENPPPWKTSLGYGRAQRRNPG